MQCIVRVSTISQNNEFLTDEFPFRIERNWESEGVIYWMREGRELERGKIEMRCVLPYQGRSEMSSSSYQTGQGCPPYQMDSLIAAVSEGKDREKNVRFENYNILIYTAIRNTRTWKKREHSESLYGLKQISEILQNDRLGVAEWLQFLDIRLFLLS